MSNDHETLTLEEEKRRSSSSTWHRADRPMPGHDAWVPSPCEAPELLEARAQTLLLRQLMAKLEARFHPPGQQDGRYIIVGHVTWPDPPAKASPRVDPSPSLALASAPATILATLRHLARAASKSIEQLESMRNQYWSFVRTDAAPRSIGEG